MTRCLNDKGYFKHYSEHKKLVYNDLKKVLLTEYLTFTIRYLSPIFKTFEVYPISSMNSVKYRKQKL